MGPGFEAATGLYATFNCGCLTDWGVMASASLVGGFALPSPGLSMQVAPGGVTNSIAVGWSVNGPIAGLQVSNDGQYSGAQLSTSVFSFGAGVQVQGTYSLMDAYNTSTNAVGAFFSGPSNITLGNILNSVNTVRR